MTKVIAIWHLRLNFEELFQRNIEEMRSFVPWFMRDT